MFNLGPLELIVIFVVALLVFGPNKLPEIGRQVGRAIREFRQFQSSFQTELRDVLEDPPPSPVVPGAAGEAAGSAPAGEAAGAQPAPDAPPPASPDEVGATPATGGEGGTTAGTGGEGGTTATPGSGPG